MEHAVERVATRTVRAAGWMVLATVLLAGCGTRVSPYGAPLTPSRVTLAPATQPDHRDSWISPDIAHSPQLLFESDIGTDEVDVYSLPDLTLKARLTGFEEPTGECSDGHGNVWIANTYIDEMVEYSRAGKQLATIDSAGPNPQGCAVDSRTGDIAVLEFSAKGYSGPGEVWVYSKPTAKPKVLRNPDLFYYEYAAYDAHGRLWVDGVGTLSPILARCGQSSCRTVVLHGGSIFSMGAIAWDAAKSTLVVFDTYCHDEPGLCSYPVSAHGTVGSPTEYQTYAGKNFCAIDQLALTTIGKQSYVVGGDSEYSCSGYKKSTIDVWPYPAGGPARRHERHVAYPYGAAVSQ
jgi:hypothetical protein